MINRGLTVLHYDLIIIVVVNWLVTESNVITGYLPELSNLCLCLAVAIYRQILEQPENQSKIVRQSVNNGGTQLSLHITVYTSHIIISSTQEKAGQRFS